MTKIDAKLINSMWNEIEMSMKSEWTKTKTNLKSSFIKFLPLIFVQFNMRMKSKWKENYLQSEESAQQNEMNEKNEKMRNLLIYTQEWRTQKLLWKKSKDYEVKRKEIYNLSTKKISIVQLILCQDKNVKNWMKCVY